ncbi:MAG TPA: glycosyltransferase [Candidatus Binataceae bacterium]
MDISVVLPVLNERENLRVLIPRLQALFAQLRITHEIIAVDGGSSDGTREIAASLGAQVVPERVKGYAGALSTGLDGARGDYVLTLDADMSHDPDFVAKMWRVRGDAEVIIASRYVRGGAAYTDFSRRVTSQFLNFLLRHVLSMPLGDLSSGFRLYRRGAIENLNLESRNIEILEEILVKIYARGYRVIEVPFTYFPRGEGRSHSRMVRYGIDLATSAAKLWKIRNSLDSADYDERAFYSVIPIQRFWQRRRHRITTNWARGAGKTLDAGCGTSVIIQSLNNPVAMDINLAKVRYLRRYGLPILRGSSFALPFKDAAFDCLISSQVIEHVPFDDALFAEMNRVLRPGGRLIIGTPDYATIGWRLIEPLYGALLPGGYHDEHITHYTHDSLLKILERHGFVHQESAYVARSELIMRLTKRAETATSESQGAVVGAPPARAASL